LYAAEYWGPHGFDYPFNIQLQIALFRVMSDEALPGSKVIFPTFYLSLLLGALAFWHRSGLEQLQATIGLVLLASVPIVFHHATLGYANLAFTYFAIFGVFWGSFGILKNERGLQAISGILLGLASWTRPEGILYCIAVLMFFLSIKFFYKQGSLDLLAIGLPILILGGSWNIFYSAHGGGGSQAMGSFSSAVQEITRGNLNSAGLFSIGKQFIKCLIDFRSWGMLFPLSMIFLLLRSTSIRKSLKPLIVIGLLSSVMFGMITALLFYVGSYQSDLENLLGWMGRSFNRTFLPACIMLFITSLSLLGHPFFLDKGSRREEFITKSNVT
jgi:hypothetical protein